MSTWLIPREELTTEQLRAIELDARENKVILGGPGSGKTQILLHRGQFLREQFKVAPNRFHIFVYTKALRDYIQSALSLLNLPDESVSTLDSWCKKFHHDHIGGRAPWDKKKKCPDFEAIRKAVLVKLLANQKKLFDFILVDEAQDLNAEAFQMFNAMANHITVCADHKQQIYDHGSDIASILRWLGVRRSNLTLLETYRCCPYVVQLASLLIEDKTERNEYIQQTRTNQIERETPLLFYARDADDEKRQLIDIVRTRLAKGERIAVLFPQRRQAYGYARGLTQAGIDTENPNELDFTTDKPKLMPYHSAKGLTFDTVILPRLSDSAFGGQLNLYRIQRLLFVGITRATKWVNLITSDNGNFQLLDLLISGAAQGCLTIRHGGTAGPATPPTTPSGDDVLDLL